MRRVKFFKYQIAEGQSHHEIVLDGEGLFHQWGCDYEEFETGAGNFSTAIIELDNGVIKNIPVEMIEFIK